MEHKRMSMTISSIKGVICDMDGVLCDSESIMCEASISMFKAQHNIDVRPSDFLPFVGTGENLYLGGVAKKYGVEFDLEPDKTYAYAKYLELIKGRLEPLDGVLDFIGWCRNQDLKLAVATSADKVKLDGNLTEIGLEHGAFDVLVSGADVVRKKPAPDIFLEAAKRLDLEPATCMVVEDAPSGIRAAKRAGCMCCGVTTSFVTAQLEAAGADIVVDKLSEIPERIGG